MNMTLWIDRKHNFKDLLNMQYVKEIYHEPKPKQRVIKTKKKKILNTSKAISGIMKTESSGTNVTFTKIQDLMGEI